MSRLRNLDYAVRAGLATTPEIGIEAIREEDEGECCTGGGHGNFALVVLIIFET